MSCLSVSDKSRTRYVQLEDMDVIFQTRRKGPVIFTRLLWVDDEIYEHYLFPWYLVAYCRSSGLVTILCQSEVVFDIIRQMTNLPWRCKKDFEKNSK